jgi:hypothetical protein
MICRAVTLARQTLPHSGGTATWRSGYVAA